MTEQNPVRDIIFAAIVGVDCTTVHRARIMSEGLADEIVATIASAPRPDADAKLADLIKKLKLLASGHSIGLGRDWQITQVNAAIAALLSLTERAASLDKTASEALQECERLRALIREALHYGCFPPDGEHDNCHIEGELRRALGAAK